MIKELHKIFGDDFHISRGINKGKENLYYFQFDFDKEKFKKLKCTISKLKHDFPELNTGYNIYYTNPISIYVWFETSIKFERKLKLKKLK